MNTQTTKPGSDSQASHDSEFLAKNDLQGTGRGEIAIIDRTGDTKVIWDKSKSAEVENARETFKRLRKEGYIIYRVVGDKGDKGEQMNEFDPDAGRLIAAPAMIGG